MSNTFGSKDLLTRLANQQQWLTPKLEQSLQEAIKTMVDQVGGDKLRHALHGDWLNEPLHAVLTDIVVGSWTATVTCDTIASIADEGELRAALDLAADATLVLGLVGAAGAAVTGMNAWSEIEKPAPRRMGLVYAAINLAATGFFVASSFHRLRDERTLARSFAGIGYLAMMAGVYLGKSLAPEHSVDA